ncbi:RND family transporter [Mycobacterium hodleri]|uniref:MMPL/RND family transporter n=1 Tax=Mycolicibacterium hodleri TaxID=49897 RepID=UPI0021F26D10|nr:RND family transporter [Mycolicibacterium hodleri]MCV7133892.1 RND family transporter [Mycolicibacterium hodleri]
MSAHGGPSRATRIIRVAAIPIILAWIAVTAALNLLVPQIEVVGQQNAVSSSPQDAPAVMAAKAMGQKFGEFTSDSVAMVVLVGDDPLGEQAHRYYDTLIATLQEDAAHVEHLQNFWGDPITAAGVQSSDGKAAYVQLNLAGNQGSTEGNASVEAVRNDVAHVAAPAGVRAYVTGPAPLTTDTAQAGDKSMVVMMAVTMVVITVMLAIVYRSIGTVLLILAMVGIEMGAARGVVALLGHARLLDFSTFAVSLLTALAIAAGTDYAIFLIGRYHEARQNGEDRESAYHSAFRGVWHVILGSGLTIAGAVLCLRLTRLTYFTSLALPAAIGVIVVVAAALTAAPAILAVASRFGLLEPKRAMKTRGWRRIGTATVRWPVPILAVATAVAILGILAVPGYTTSYEDRHYIPESVPSNEGYNAAEKHFSAARLNPDIMMIESDHDLRNPSDMIVLDRIAKSLFAIRGIAMVQSITRPLGSPIAHSSIPYQVSMQSVPITQNLQFLTTRIDDIDTMATDLGSMIDSLRAMHEMMARFSDATARTVVDMSAMKDSVDQMRDHLADFDDAVRPLRNYFYWEPNCFNIPVCWGARSAFDAVDGVDGFSGDMGALIKDFGDVNALTPQLAAQLPPIIATATTMQQTLQAIHTTFAGLLDQMKEMTDTATAMGQAFDASKSADYFYLPPEVFQNPDFQRGLKLFLSPDGKAARLIITHDVDPATEAGISAVDDELVAAREAVKGTPLADAKVFLTGTAATYRDIQSGAKFDLMIAAFAAIVLIFLVMLLITRALVASLVIVGTIVVSLGASFGLSVLIWERIIGVDMHWIVLAFSVIILLAVGSDYNLLLVSRFKEEVGAGIKTGIIRTMGSTGSVVTAAGLVFAFTMASMLASDLRHIGQAGSTIGLGLLFDTLIVRSLMTPSIAAILGRWFWWPLNIPNRPRRQRVRNDSPVSAPL